MTKYIKGFKIKNNDEVFKMEDTLSAMTAEHALNADNATHASTADSVDAIGNVEKYSGLYGGKQREGLKFMNGVNEALIELNSRGNFAFESLTKHVNIESAQGVQVKPTTNVILDSSRRIENNKGNEINLEAKFDDYKDRTNPEYSGKDGFDEEWAELKIKSRNLDLRCNDHGGIALQIAGSDSGEHENKIKFESDRVNNIGAGVSGSYCGEGGKGLEFGTFNNEHASLFCGDYRFKGSANVYGVTRGELELNSKGKTDYPTQNDDFKDILDENNKASWNEIIAAANMCKGKENVVSMSEVNAKITERAAELAGGGSITLDGYATEQYVQNYVSEHGGGGSNLTPGSGIIIDDGVISVNSYNNIIPLTALTNDIEALKSVEYSKSGNLQFENKGDFSFKAQTDAPDENGNIVIKGDKAVSQNLAYYEANNAYFYKAKVDTTYYDGTPAPAKTVIFMADIESNAEALAYYENPDYYYKAKYDTVDFLGNPVSAKSVVYKSQMVTSGETEEAFYQDSGKYGYKCLVTGALDENNNERTKGEIIDISEITTPKYYKNRPTEWEKVMTWERVDIWEKSPIWERNSCNINIETDSKIKLNGEKIEMFFKDDEDTGEMSPLKTGTIVATEFVPLVNQFAFERSVSKNGVETGCDPIISFTYKNNVKDITKVPDFETFKAGWESKHTVSRTDEELQEIYDRLKNEEELPTISTKLTTLLGLVGRVAALEETVASLTARIAALEGNQNNPE